MFSRSILEPSISDELATEAKMTFDRLGGIMGQLKLGSKSTSEANVAARAMVHGISMLIIERLLTVGNTRNIFHALIGTGKAPAESETDAQVVAAARILTAGTIAKNDSHTG